MMKGKNQPIETDPEITYMTESVSWDLKSYQNYDSHVQEDR